MIPIRVLEGNSFEDMASVVREEVTSRVSAMIQRGTDQLNGDHFTSSRLQFVVTLASFFLTVVFTARVLLSAWGKRRRKTQKQRELTVLAQSTRLNRLIAKRIKTHVGEYEPPWWYNRHLGTAVAFGYNPSLVYEREIFTASDGIFAVDWYPRKPTTGRRGIKICVFYPGLGLGSGNKFAQQFVHTMSREGYHCAVVTSRGVDVPLKSSRFWHPGLYDDSKMVLEHIDENFPQANIFLVGFSAGTNIVQKTVLDKSLRVRVRGIMCVCVGRDYVGARNALEDTFEGRIYSRLMTSLWKEIVMKNAHIHADIGADVVARLMRCNYLSEYDKIAFDAVYGFSTEEEYASALSAVGTEDISVPFLALQPRDDPLHQGDARISVVKEEYTRNQNVIYVQPEKGNHFGFYEGPLMQAFSNKTSYTYPGRIALEFFEAILQNDQ